jgi:hypothetical protein
MTEMLVKILVELLSTLALTTKEVRQGKPSKLVFMVVLYITHNVTQRNLSRSCLERKIPRRFFKDWTDSPRTRRS